MNTRHGLSRTRVSVLIAALILIAATPVLGQNAYYYWTQHEGSLTDISVGSNGTVWGVSDGSIFRRDGNQRTRIPGALSRISVGSATQVWGVDGDGAIFRRDGDRWTHLPGKLIGVSVGSATKVWGVDGDGDIFQLNDEPADAAAEAWRNAVNKPPADWHGNVFTLSHDYPLQQPQPPADGYPWEAFDFETQPAKYIQAVLDYAREDLEAIDWDPTKMENPTWFHAPWMAEGPSSGNGREYIRGMTKERPSRKGELSPEQTNNFIANYAVGLYNDVGGWTFGRVWAIPGKPDLSDDKAIFKNGAMAIKLLYTAADPDVPGDGVPYLKNSKEWRASIAPFQSSDRVPRTLRLLQVDIAVRDKRNDSLTGWLFGTFVYNGNKSGETPFDRLAPVGLMWGDSPGITPTDVMNGQKPSQQWINADVGTYQHLGWATRINGPVDNPASSCISCHGGGAETPALTPMVPPRGATDTERLEWFGNIKAGVAKDAAATSLDYSLQMSVAMQNWLKWAKANNLQPAGLERLMKEYPVNRGEEPRE